MVQGWIIGGSEIVIYFIISHLIRKRISILQTMNRIIYYWMTMTVLTMIWEIFFIVNYKSVNILAQQLILNNTHVWTKDYDMTYILPWKLSHIFYAEYGAYADKDYMLLYNDWSRVIESSHALFCGLFAFLTLYHRIKDPTLNRYFISLGISMGSQLMNSILYMMNYFNQLAEPSNINYCSPSFPCGHVLVKRAFMYVNIFWTIMPLYAILSVMINPICTISYKPFNKICLCMSKKHQDIQDKELNKEFISP